MRYCCALHKNYYNYPVMLDSEIIVGYNTADNPSTITICGRAADIRAGFDTRKHDTVFHFVVAFLNQECGKKIACGQRLEDHKTEGIADGHADRKIVQKRLPVSDSRFALSGEII